MSGRQAEAARNDQRILDSARAVFVADPGAPITAVAKHAGVGISALYTRYGSKEELLRTLCTDGLLIVVRETEAALERVKKGDDHWQVFAGFMRNLADADTSSMTRALAGKFAPTPEMFALANRSSELMAELFGLIRDVLRPDLSCTTSRWCSSWWPRSSSPTPGAPPSCATGTWRSSWTACGPPTAASCPARRPTGRSSANAGDASSAKLRGAPGAGPALALVHGLDPGDRDRAPLLDQSSAQRLRRGQLPRPRVLAGHQPGRGVHGEVARRHTVEVVPAHRERDRDPRAHPRAVRRRHRRAERPGRVQEDLALPVVLDERRGGQGRIKALGPRGEARVAAAASSLLASTGTYTCSPLDPLVLTAPDRPTSVSA